MAAESSAASNSPVANEDAVASPSSSSAAVAVSSISLPSNRFELELEFVQSLASPAYLHYLATSGILYQSAFLDFLRYLRYWKQPQFAKYLLYPHCLYFLDLLVPPSPSDLDTGSAAEDGGDGSSTTGGGDTKSKSEPTSAVITDSGEAFRREMAQLPFRNFVHEQQFYSWQFRSARLYGGGEGKKEEGGEGS
ncbi:hypothetical protein ACHAXR_005747 [Thalassiosira sp. AJA248-18]